MAYDIESARISRSPTGEPAISDRFSEIDHKIDSKLNILDTELNQKMDSKIGQEQFDKSVELIRSDIKSVSDKLHNDIKDYNLTTIREMNSCLETISKNFSAGISEVSRNLEEHVKFVDDCKKEQDEFNRDVVNTIGSICKAFKVVTFILGLNMASILAIVIYLCTM